MSMIGAVVRSGLSVGVVASLILGALPAAPSAYGAGTEGSESTPAVAVMVRDGFVSVEARNTALGNIIKAIAEQADFELVDKSDSDQKVTWSMKYVPVEEAIRLLLGRYSWVLTYGTNAEGALLPVAGLYILRSGGPPAGEQPVQRATHSFVQIEREEQFLVLQQLIQQPDPAVAVDLALLLTNREEAAIRRMATIALGHLQVPEAKEALVEALDDENTTVRRSAVMGLGRMWGNRAFEDISRVLSDDPDPIVRSEAVVRIGLIGGEEATELLRLTDLDSDMWVRRAAKNVLGHLKGSGGFSEY